jgi:hypothetical protein
MLTSMDSAENGLVGKIEQAKSVLVTIATELV